MGYIQELDAIQRFAKISTDLNSWRLQEAPVMLDRPVILWLPPNRLKDRHVNHLLYVKRVSQYGTLYVNSLDQLGALMDSLEAYLEDSYNALPVYQDQIGPTFVAPAEGVKIGYIKAVTIEFGNTTGLDIPITVRYEATYSRTLPEEYFAPPADKVGTKINLGG